MSNRNNSLKPRNVIGIALILAAVALFLNNIGFGFIGAIFSQWPLALIIIGVVLLIGPHSEKNKAGSYNFLPYFLIGVGVLILLIKYRIFNFSIGALIVPLILLFVGFKILRSSIHSRATIHPPVDEGENTTADNATPNNREKIDLFCVLSGGDYSTRSQNLGNGNVTCLMGGADIDIRDADTQEQQLELNVFAVMGGIVLKIPAHWQVTMNVVPLLGGITNKTTCLAEKMNLPRKQLLITGTVFMGGIDVRN